MSNQIEQGAKGNAFTEAVKRGVQNIVLDVRKSVVRPPIAWLTISTASLGVISLCMSLMTYPDASSSAAVVAANSSPIGSFDVINWKGSASGWTLDPDNATQSNKVQLYVDRENGGPLLGQVVASESRPDVNSVTGYPGNHGFSFSIPIGYLDGKKHTLTTYGVDLASGVGAPLPNSPKTFQMFQLLGLNGWNPGLTQRKIATTKIDKTYFEDCPDHTGGCYQDGKGIPPGGGFYTLSPDLASISPACKVNSGEYFTAGGVVNQKCPYFFSWGKDSAGALSANLTINTSDWSQTMTPNIYLGFHENTPYAGTYLGGNNMPLIDRAEEEFTVNATAVSAPSDGAKIRFLAGVSWYSPVTKESYVIEINFDEINGSSFPEWSTTAEATRSSYCEAGVTCLYLGGRYWGMPTVFGKGETKVLINWGTIVTKLVADGYLPAAAVGPFPVGTFHIGPELLGKMKSTVAISGFRSATVNVPARGWFDPRSNEGVNTVYGWALDPNNPADVIAVHVYADGPAGTGKWIGATSANLPRPDVNTATGYPGNHGYLFTLPSSLSDGRSHTLYVYGIDAQGGYNPPLLGSPQTYRPMQSIR